jgi:hypothetical protein
MWRFREDEPIRVPGGRRSGGVIQLDYALTSTDMTFRAEVLGVDKTRTSQLSVDTPRFRTGPSTSF